MRVLRERATPSAPLTARQLADATGLAPTTVHGALGPLTKRGEARLIEQRKGRKSYAFGRVAAATGS